MTFFFIPVEENLPMANVDFLNQAFLGKLATLSKEKTGFDFASQIHKDFSSLG